MSNNATQLERLTFFSDAVFAIAITLLVIEIHVPRLGVVDDQVFLAALASLRPSIFGFVLSFLVIGSLWAAHHRVFGMLVGYSRSVMVPNMLLLLVIAFMPFATALMSANPLSRVAEMFYAATLLLAALIQRLLFGRALQPGYLQAELTPGDVAAVRGRAWGLPVAAALSLLLAWFVPAWNNMVLLAIPLLTRWFAHIARVRAEKTSMAVKDIPATSTLQRVELHEPVIAASEPTA
ncbi:TMEM175 family protein [Rhodanobacter sp. L36]|uniref:TMEM175 family protein n=1 Tax=Rhodanobacter sp. L36 TaxID=1747221 RepID=UPI00131B1A0C|nr:TMEM175 family protein [Rhodanobacter sp. L36]